jgi:UDP-glucose 4-epimerase
MTNAIAITGAAGFIGHHLVKKIAETDCEIRAIDNLQSGNWKSLPDGVQAINQDITTMDEKQRELFLRDVKVFYHLAAEKYNSSSMTPERVVDANIVATEKLFRTAVRVGVPRIVFTSSLYAYGNTGPSCMHEGDVPLPNTHYGVSKLAGEHFLRTLCSGSATSWNVARLLFIYGPGQFSGGGYKSVIVKNFERILEGKNPIINGDGLQSLDYVFVEDCINALLLIGNSELSLQTVNVASGEATSIQSLVKQMCSVSNTTFIPEYAANDATHGTFRVGKNTQINDLFGWTPKTSMEDGLRKTWEWMNLEGANGG